MENTFQLNFVNRLKQFRTSDTLLVEDLVEVLQISADSVYRRLRGTTAMSIDEAIRICNHFRIPITYFVEETPGLVNFKYLPPESRKENFHKHLQMIASAVNELLDHENRKIIYAAIDAPLFYHFGIEKLAAFKMHFWMRVILGVDSFKDYYDEREIDREFLALGKNIYEDYLMIPSDEIWPEDILQTTLKQIEFYWDAGYFKTPEETIDILNHLSSMIDNVEKMAINSHKLKFDDKSMQKYAAFNLFHSDVLPGNNTVLSIADKKTVYISHMTFHTMITGSEAYVNHTEDWLKAIMSKSTLISGVSEKNRIKFFRALRRSVEEVIDKVKPR